MNFDMQIRCKACDGQGKTSSVISSEDILSIVHSSREEGAVQKIPAIKEVRNQYEGIGLKEAKELVEGAMAYYEAIEKYSVDYTITT